MIYFKNNNKIDITFIFNDDKRAYKNPKYFKTLEDFYTYIKAQNITNKTNILVIGDKSNEYTNLLEFIIYYNETKRKIEKDMKLFNKQIKTDKNEIINQALDYFKESNSNGKCIRGTLINLGYNAKKNNDYAIKLASAYEAFETSILIHDDIIDNSDLRRNKQTIHKKYQDDFKDYKQDNTPYNLALCIGDAGFFYTYNYIIKNYKNDKNILKVLNYYNDVVLNTIKGEILDVYLPYIEKNNKKHIITEDVIMSIYRLKTSIYTIVGPFILGMILSGSSKKDQEYMTHALTPLGISFQIKDDILGIMSKSEALGKPVYSDIEEFKQTILYSYIKLYKKEYLDELLKYYGNKINNDDLLKVQEIIIKSGALDYANDRMNDLFNDSKEMINKSKINKKSKKILLGFITYLSLRKK